MVFKSRHHNQLALAYARLNSPPSAFIFTSHPLTFHTSALIHWPAPYPDPPSPIRSDDAILAARDADGGVRMYGADGGGLEYGDVRLW